MTRVAAIFRSPTYSPAEHGQSDAAILEATLRCLTARGMTSERADERSVEEGHLPQADFYLNMAQGRVASERLVRFESRGARLMNRPASVLACHRRRLVRRLAESGIAFPPTILTPTSGGGMLDEARRAKLYGDDDRLWIKRGDVHAERPEDVVSVAPTAIDAALRAFAARGIPWVAVQKHVPGPVVKFYAIAGGRFFRWYGADAGPDGARPPADERAIERLVFEAATRVGLEVFGGDLVLPSPARPVLVDLNDWPSFSAFRTEAAEAIADYVEERVAAG